MSDKPAPAKAPEPKPDPKPAAAAKRPRKKPLVTHLAPPSDQPDVGRTAIHGARDISWQRGPVVVVDNGRGKVEARITLNPLGEDRGPNVYAMTPYHVQCLIQQGQARVATPIKTLTPKDLAVAEKEELAKRRERTAELRRTGAKIEPQAGPETRRYGRDVYTVLPLRQIEGGAA